VTLQIIGIFILCGGLLLEIAMIGSEMHLGTIIAIVGVILYVYGRFQNPRNRGG
jgi:hypothetical protein